MNFLNPGRAVILADNDSLMRSIMRSLLTRAKQHVYSATDGDEAVNFARQVPAALVVLDVGMPRLNGLLTCRAIRRLPGYDAVPIVIVTGYNHDLMREAAGKVGATDFVAKPFRPDVLMTVLSRHLRIQAPQPISFPKEDLAKPVQQGPVTVWNVTRVGSDERKLGATGLAYMA